MMESIVLGGGCFLCLDASFKLIKGVESVVSGYAGGTAEHADYYKVGSGKTGHAEVVQVTFDPTVISLNDVLDLFWAMHDPTTLNRQGNDVGPQYRSAIFYSNDAQKQVIDASITEAQKLWDDEIVTEVSLLDVFYPAEDYHQNYFANNPENAYCQIVINPKLAKLRAKFTQLIA